jgi:hypothetical protein
VRLAGGDPGYRRTRARLLELARDDISKEEVNQTRNYLSAPMGSLGLMVVNKLPNSAAHIKRNSVYTKDKKVILFITAEHLKECFT